MNVKSVEAARRDVAAVKSIRIVKEVNSVGRMTWSSNLVVQKSKACMTATEGWE